MIRSITSLYATLLKGLLVLATAGAISAISMENAAETAGHSVRTGLISLKALNARLGF